VVRRDALAESTVELARELCRSSPIAVREAKRAIDLGLSAPLEHGVELEDLAWRRAVASQDRAEGIAAFNERREPRWKGR
jgi:enoyl-CoA hydratase/carnithine racemase